MLVKSLKQLPKLSEIPDTISLDFEIVEGTDIIKGFSFAYLKGKQIKSFYCPIAHTELEFYSDVYNCKNLPKKEIFKYLQDLIKDRTLVFHNAEFDTNILKRNNFKFDFNKIEDTMLMHYSLDTERLHGLKSIMKNEYNINVVTYDEARLSDFDEFSKYADNDAKYTLFLYYKLLKELKNNKKVYELYKNYEIPFIKVLQSMNYDNNGIAIDFNLLQKYKKLIEDEINITLALLKDKLGDINFNSTQQLAVVLKKVGYKLALTAKGNPALGEKELLKLQKKQGGKIIDLILYYRMLNKLNTTYIKPYIENLSFDGENYYLSGYDFSHIGTRTGRLSSHNPNLQNQPRDIILMKINFLIGVCEKLNVNLTNYFLTDKELNKFYDKFKSKEKIIEKVKENYYIDIRKIFIARKGYKFIGADFSQIELRMAAHCSNDKLMINAYLNNEDIHQQTADKINKLLGSKFTRQEAKAVNFGVLYGLYYNSLSEQTGLKLKDAKNLIDAWWRLYSGVRNFVNKAHAIAKTTGYAETILGRRRNMITLGIRAKDNFRANKYAENATISHIISGSSADLIKVAMINIYNKYNKDVIIKLQVHDELLIEVKEELADKYKELIKNEMETALKLRVPIEANVKVGNNWREVH